MGLLFKNKIKNISMRNLDFVWGVCETMGTLFKKRIRITNIKLFIKVTII